MPSYLSLLDWTQQGIRDVKGAPGRIDAFKAAVQGAGGRVIFLYMLMGEHDFATLIEVADDETASRIMVELGRLGNVRSQTMRAFTEDETKALLGGMG